MIYTIAGQLLDDQMPLSNRYKLADLIKTNTIPQEENLPYPNSPEITNLKWLARTLEELEDTIGPFLIISAFRSAKLQDSLRANYPAASRKKSFHEAGMAVDIFPLSMSCEEYFGRLISSNWLTNLGEIALKPTQNTLHLSLPGKFVGKVQIMQPDHSYKTLSKEEIDQYAAPYVNQSTMYNISKIPLNNGDFQTDGEDVALTGETEEFEVNTIELMQERALKKKLMIGSLILSALIAAFFYIKNKIK